MWNGEVCKLKKNVTNHSCVCIAGDEVGSQQPVTVEGEVEPVIDLPSLQRVVSASQSFRDDRPDLTPGSMRHFSRTPYCVQDLIMFTFSPFVNLRKEGKNNPGTFGTFASSLLYALRCSILTYSP